MIYVIMITYITISLYDQDVNRFMYHNIHILYMMIYVHMIICVYCCLFPGAKPASSHIVCRYCMYEQATVIVY